MTTGYQWARKRMTAALREEVVAMHREEDQLHIAIVHLLEVAAAPGVVWWHTPNGGKRSKREAARFRAMGVLAGVADFAISMPGGRFAFIEVKSRGGCLSAEQKAFLRSMEANGHQTAVVRSLADASAALTGWSAIRNARVAA